MASTMLLKNYFPVNLKKIRGYWKKTVGAKQEGFAGYTRTMMQTYEDYRVEAPYDLVFFMSENTGIPIGDLMTREILLNEIPELPGNTIELNMEEEAMQTRREQRVAGLAIPKKEKAAVSED